MGKKQKRLIGQVRQIISPVLSDEGEMAEIALDGCEDLFREIRVENGLTDESGKTHKLRVGDTVEVIILMNSEDSATTEAAAEQSNIPPSSTLTPRRYKRAQAVSKTPHCALPCAAARATKDNDLPRS